jgi:hypothetical protein
MESYGSKFESETHGQIRPCYYVFILFFFLHGVTQVNSIRTTSYTSRKVTQMRFLFVRGARPNRQPYYDSVITTNRVLRIDELITREPQTLAHYKSYTTDGRHIVHHGA